MRLGVTGLVGYVADCDECDRVTLGSGHTVSHCVTPWTRSPPPLPTNYSEPPRTPAPGCWRALAAAELRPCCLQSLGRWRPRGRTSPSWWGTRGGGSTGCSSSPGSRGSSSASTTSPPPSWATCPSTGAAPRTHSCSYSGSIEQPIIISISDKILLSFEIEFRMPIIYLDIFIVWTKEGKLSPTVKV